MDIQNIDTLARKRFGIFRLRPYQKRVITSILRHCDENHPHGLLVVLPTGSGKSLCFMLPAILAEHAMLVLYPLLSLMNDQKRRFEAAGFPAPSCVEGRASRSGSGSSQTLPAEGPRC